MLSHHTMTFFKKITPASTPYINGGLEADLNYTTMYDRLIRSIHKAGKNMLVAKMY